MAPVTLPTASVMRPRPPLARNMPTALRMATRYGMIITAREKASLAPATKTS